MNNPEKTIVVIGATGLQGSGVVNALKSKTGFSVRAVTRNTQSYNGQADQVVGADLDDSESLKAAFEGAYGVFLVTNFLQAGDEIAQAKRAISAAQSAGIKHLVWSTLPDATRVSGGRFEVPHFTNKSAVDEWVREAGFQYHTFVVATFYYQNLLTSLAPQAQPDGTPSWALPIARDSKSIHMADISELGEAVAGAFAQPEIAGQGQYLPVVGDLLSFDDIVETLAKQGKQYRFEEVPDEVFSDFFPGAHEFAQMFRYFQAHTYLGDQLGDKEIALATLDQVWFQVSGTLCNLGGQTSLNLYGCPR